MSSHFLRNGHLVAQIGLPTDDYFGSTGPSVDCHALNPPCRAYASVKP